MGEQERFVTVFRSADHSAREQAEAIEEALRAMGIAFEVLDDKEPGVLSGVVEIRVAAGQAAEAESARDRTLARLAEMGVTHDLDMVSVFSSDAHDAEMEAMTVEGLLQANGIDTELIGPSVLPVLSFQVQVPREDRDEALRIIEEARAGGAAELDKEFTADSGDGQ